MAAFAVSIPLCNAGVPWEGSETVTHLQQFNTWAGVLCFLASPVLVIAAIVVALRGLKRPPR
jgi:hypothetical protein